MPAARGSDGPVGRGRSRHWLRRDPSSYSEACRQRPSPSNPLSREPVMSFFAPPPTVTAEVFTRLPDHFRNARPTAWANANRGGHAIDSFLEGPAFDRAGRLYVTDVPFGRVFRIDAQGAWELVA